jgi:hypothetical protein
MNFQHQVGTDFDLEKHFIEYHCLHCIAWSTNLTKILHDIAVFV